MLTDEQRVEVRVNHVNREYMRWHQAIAEDYDADISMEGAFTAGYQVRDAEVQALKDKLAEIHRLCWHSAREDSHVLDAIADIVEGWPDTEGEANAE